MALHDIAAFETWTRAEIEEAIQALIDRLDDSEPDADLEPSLGWACGGCGLSDANASAPTDDREDDTDSHEGWYPDEQGEPELAWEERLNQTLLIAGGHEDDNETGVADEDALEEVRHDFCAWRRYRRSSADEAAEVDRCRIEARRLSMRSRGHDPSRLGIIGHVRGVFFAALGGDGL